MKFVLCSFERLWTFFSFYLEALSTGTAFSTILQQTLHLNAVSVVFVQISCHAMDTYQHCNNFSIASLIGVDMKYISINQITKDILFS